MTNDSSPPAAHGLTPQTGQLDTDLDRFNFPALFAEGDFEALAASWDKWRPTWRCTAFAGTKSRAELADAMRAMGEHSEPVFEAFCNGVRGLAEYVESLGVMLRNIEARAFLAAADAHGLTLDEVFADEGDDSPAAEPNN